MDNPLIPYYEKSKLMNNDLERYFNFSISPSYSLPEIAETAIARNNPSLALELLKKQEREKSYQTTLFEAASIAKSYINSLSSERISKIRDININVKRENPSLLRKLLYGEKEIIEIDIDVI
ncbi:MAG: hypothetical protein QW273_01015 [Candidatus Pacearchaeota archaeon]